MSKPGIIYPKTSIMDYQIWAIRNGSKFVKVPDSFDRKLQDLMLEYRVSRIECSLNPFAMDQLGYFRDKSVTAGDDIAENVISIRETNKD